MLSREVRLVTIAVLAGLAVFWIAGTLLRCRGWRRRFVRWRCER